MYANIMGMLGHMRCAHHVSGPLTEFLDTVFRLMMVSIHVAKVQVHETFRPRRSLSVANCNCAKVFVSYKTVTVQKLLSVTKL